MSNSPSVQNLFDLSGRVALVTGGTGHLGGSIALALAEAGASVIVTSRNKKRAELVAADLPIKGEAGHKGIALDHIQTESLEGGFNDSVAAFGKIDILVNNGIEYVPADTNTCTGDDFGRQLANATGYFLLARMLRDHVVQRKSRASVILMGSMYGMVASYPDVYQGITSASPASYHVLKGGIIHLVRHLSVYWAPMRFA